MSVQDINRLSCTHALREPANGQKMNTSLLSFGVQPLSDLLAAVVFRHHMRDTLTTRREYEAKIEDGHTNHAESGTMLKSKQINRRECYNDVVFKIILLEHVFNVKTFFPAQLSEEMSSTGSHFSLKKEQHNLWEFDGVCLLSLGGCSALSWWPSSFPSL